MILSNIHRTSSFLGSKSDELRKSWGSDIFQTEGVRLRQEVERIAKQKVDLLSEENKIIKVLAQCKNSSNGPLISVKELYNLGNKCIIPQAALHTDMNLEIRFRALTLITINGVCALISSQIGFSASDEIDYLEASILNRQGKEQIILASQPRLVPTAKRPSQAVAGCAGASGSTQRNSDLFTSSNNRQFSIIEN